MTNPKCQIVALCVLGLVFGHAASTETINESDCPQFCSAIYKPVCATDGKAYEEFANACLLQSSNCRRNRSGIQTFTETDLAWCNSEKVENLQEKLGNLNLEVEGCLKPCAMIYQPVCVTNGKYRGIVSNSCVLETFNCALKSTGATELLRILRTESC